MPSQEIKCAEPGCNIIFEFTERDQSYYAEQGYPPPKRCSEHRLKQRERFKGKDNERRN